MSRTPLRYVTMSNDFASLPVQNQQEIMFVLGTDTLPPVELEDKSLVQLMFDDYRHASSKEPPDTCTPNMTDNTATTKVLCARGPLILETDLPTMDLDMRDDANVTFMMMACEFGAVRAVQALVDAGADVDAVDDWGNSALHYACGAGHRACIEALLLAGARHGRESLNCEALGCQSPEDMAESRGHGLVFGEAMKAVLVSEEKRRKSARGGEAKGCATGIKCQNVDVRGEDGRSGSVGHGFELPAAVSLPQHMQCAKGGGILLSLLFVLALSVLVVGLFVSF